MGKEQKAKAYADVYFYATDDSFESEDRKYVIEHFKAGFEAGKQEGEKGKDFETQVAYNCGREAERKEIVEMLKSYTDQLDKEGNSQAVFCINDFIESLSNNQSNK